jgi:hypothetical protein
LNQENNSMYLNVFVYIFILEKNLNQENNSMYLNVFVYILLCNFFKISV